MSGVISTEMPRKLESLPDDKDSPTWAIHRMASLKPLSPDRVSEKIPANFDIEDSDDEGRGEGKPTGTSENSTNSPVASSNTGAIWNSEV